MYCRPGFCNESRARGLEPRALDRAREAPMRRTRSLLGMGIFLTVGCGLAWASDTVPMLGGFISPVGHIRPTVIPE